MKKECLALLMISSSIATAATPIEGWYDTIFGGYAYLPNNLSITKNSLTLTDANYTSSFDAGISFGFKSTPLRYVGELTYINNKLNQFKINRVSQTQPSGYNRDIFAMANVYYDFPALIATIEPFLGVGIGYGYLNAQFKNGSPIITTRYDVSQNVFAYQGIAGLTFNFAECYALNIGYRYLATDNVSRLGKMFQAHLANVGAIYRFDGQIYK